MTPEQMDRELKRAWRWLMASTRRDEELSTDALPYVWRQLQQPGARLSRRVVRRALWLARRFCFGNGQSGHRKAYNALDVAKALPNYSTASSRELNPARAAMVKEAVQLVESICTTHFQRTMVRSRILGCVFTLRPDGTPPQGEQSYSGWPWFVMKCRKRFPSLIGIA